VSLVVASVGFGLITASILALGAVGFTLQFGITNILNLAFGNIMTAAAFVAYYVNALGVNIWFCLLVGAVFGAALSAGLNRFLFTPFAGRRGKAYATVILTLAVGLIIQNLVLAIGGINFFSYTLVPGPTLRLGAIQLTVAQLGIMGLAAGSMMGLHLLLRRTKLGKAMRATASDVELARASGIPTRRITDIAWLLSGAMCGAAGVTLVMNTTTFQAGTGNEFLVVVIAAAVLGGVGQPYGAMLGALVLGVATEVSAAFVNPSYKDVIAFAILVLVLVLRPQGVIAGLSRERAVAT